MKYLPLDAGLFKKNRKRFVDKMEKNAIAIFNSNDELPTNGDALHPFKQNSDLVWLTGIVQEDTMLVLFPNNPDPKYREVLVLVRPNELKENGMAIGYGHTKPPPSPASIPLFGWIAWMHCSSLGFILRIPSTSTAMKTTAKPIGFPFATSGMRLK